jgi:amino acid adenylation domain-containing protein
VQATVRPCGEFIDFGPDAIEQSIPNRFEQQVDRRPDRIAVRMRSDELTYAELDAWADRIAGALLEQLGEGQEPVGILLAQGAPAVAAILGVLKAGKFYVPLDPSFPAARLADTREWIGAKVVATDSRSISLARSVAGRPGDALDVDRLRRSDDAGRLSGLVASGDIAYVFFTSGSTGAPKGVFDSHRNVLHNVARYTNALAISADDRLTLLQSCAFSGSVSSLFGALLNGATIFPFDFAAEGPLELGRHIRRERLTMYHSVPSIFRSVLTGTVRFPEMRVVRLEGDRASSVDAALYRRHFGPDCVLANGLGTTETGLCRQYLIDRTTQLEDGILPVGYAVADMDVEIVDEDGVPVGVGEKGEIAVRSRYLALGYWRRPDLTDAAFRTIPDGERAYRTGDIGRMRADGCLEYLGRKDFQLKVRGHRVEVADVESLLIASEGVKDAAVTTREKENGEVELVAYVVGDGAARLETSTLRAQLGRKLPGHLVPTRFLRLDELPVNESGKVDRNRLPSPAEVTRPRRRRGRKPRTPIERQLVGIWQEVLNVAPIGLDESLLDLGGDSLARAVIAARIEDETGYRVPPDGLDESTTVGQLADALQGTLPEGASPLVPIEPLGFSAPLFLIHDLNGEVGRYAELARWLGPDQPLWGLRHTSDHETIELMAAHYLDEMRTVQAAGPYRLGGWCFGAVVAFEIAHQLRAAGDEVTLLALMGISAFDFSDLVSPAAWRRYRQTSTTTLDRRIRFHLSAARTMTAGRGAAYLVRTAARPVLRAVRGRGSSHQPQSACRAAFDRYTPRPYDGRAFLILAETETASYSDDPGADWHDLCSEGVDVLIVPGDHHEVLVEPNVRAVGDDLRARLSPDAIRVASLLPD